MSDERELIGDGFDPKRVQQGPIWVECDTPIVFDGVLDDWSRLSGPLPKGSLWSRIRGLPYTLPTRIWLWRETRKLK